MRNVCLEQLTADCFVDETQCNGKFARKVLLNEEEANCTESDLQV